MRKLTFKAELTNPVRPWSVLLAIEVGRTREGRWFAYVNARNRNYWIRRY